MRSKRLEALAIVAVVVVVCATPLLLKENLSSKSIAKNNLDVKSIFAALERGQ